MPLTGLNRGWPRSGVEMIMHWHNQNQNRRTFNPERPIESNQPLGNEQPIRLPYPTTGVSNTYNAILIERLIDPLKNSLKFFNLIRDMEFDEVRFNILIARIAGYGPMILGDTHPRNKAIINFFLHYWDSGLYTAPVLTEYRFNKNLIIISTNGIEVAAFNTNLDFELIDKELYKVFKNTKYIIGSDLSECLDALGYKKLHVA